MYETLEEAQARIIELEDEKNNLTSERDTLLQNNKDLETQCEDLRTLNQKYFNRLIAQDTAENNKEDEESEEIPTCEEFAKNIKI